MASFSITSLTAFSKSSLHLLPDKEGKREQRQHEVRVGKQQDGGGGQIGKIYPGEMQDSRTFGIIIIDPYGNNPEVVS